MAEYIKRDAIKARLEDLVDWCQDLRKPGLEQALAMLNEEPVADVAPVVHGLWEREPSSSWRWTPSGAVAVTRTTYRCGLCGRGTAVKSNCCPHCGAKDVDKLERQEYWGNERCFDYVDAEDIDNAPTVDAVEVVRCKDCRKFKTYACRMVASGYDDFCSYGERKESADNG